MDRGVGRKAVWCYQVAPELPQDNGPGCLASHAVNRYDAAKLSSGPLVGGAWLHSANRCSFTGWSQEANRRVGQPSRASKGKVDAGVAGQNNGNVVLTPIVPAARRADGTANGKGRSNSQRFVTGTSWL